MPEEKPVIVIRGIENLTDDKGNPLELRITSASHTVVDGKNKTIFEKK